MEHLTTWKVERFVQVIPSSSPRSLYSIKYFVMYQKKKKKSSVKAPKLNLPINII